MKKGIRAEIREGGIYGIGTNDATYAVKTMRADGSFYFCPLFVQWQKLVKAHKTKPTLTKSWLRFSNFLAFVKENDDGSGKKMVRISSDVVYSPSNCIFVEPMVASFINAKHSSRNKMLRGVAFCNKRLKFTASCVSPFNGKKINLGLYETQQHAHRQWINKQRQFAIILSAKYMDSDDEYDMKVVQALRNKYSRYDYVESPEVADDVGSRI
jgi:hypothetical protein